MAGGRETFTIIRPVGLLSRLPALAGLPPPLLGRVMTDLTDFMVRPEARGFDLIVLAIGAENTKFLHRYAIDGLMLWAKNFRLNLISLLIKELRN